MIFLIVDDHPTDRKLLRVTLEGEGHSTLEADDGAAALQVLARETVDAVISDINMPNMTGLQLLIAIKSDEILRNIPVIMVSAAADRETLVRCIERGAEDYLTKPFDAVLLRARIGAFLEKKRLRDSETAHLRHIQELQQRADELLRVILPDSIAVELMEHNSVKPQRHSNVGVLFSDIVGFTPYCDNHPPDEVLEHLQRHILTFEEIAARNGLEKIKTIGDAFMATAGLLEPSENPALDCVRCSLDMVRAAQGLPSGWNVHIGIHVGPVTAGVVGRLKLFFDVWGDTVNTAARLCSLAGPASIYVNDSTWEALEPWCQGHPCGLFQVKGKGGMEIFRVEAIKG